MTHATASQHTFKEHDRIYLEKLRLAAIVILDLADEEGVINDAFQAELFLFRDRIERELLLPD